MRLDSSRVPRGCQLLRDPAAWTESADHAYATDISRNAYAGKLDKELMWCADPDTLAKHMAESATNSGSLGQSKMGGAWASRTQRPSRPEAHRGRKIKRLRAKHKLQGQIGLKDWFWNDKKQWTRVYIDEMVDKDGNIWARCLARLGAPALRRSVQSSRGGDPGRETRAREPVQCGGASFLTFGPGGDQMWPLVSDTQKCHNEHV